MAYDESKNKSKMNGGISEAEAKFVESRSPPSKSESIINSIGDILTMGSVSRMNKNQEERDRKEFFNNYKK